MSEKRTTIIDFVEKYTRQFADHPYLREKVNGEWKVITQEQTRETAYRIAAGLMALGCEKGDKIALLSESRAMWVLAELGAMYAGMTDVPLSVNLGEGKDLIFRINHSESKWILVSGNHLPKIRAILGECPQVEKVIVFDDTAFDYQELEEKEIRISEIMKMGDDFLAGHRDAFVARYQSIGPDDYANISYTSGTTADPKGILLTDPPQLHRERGPGPFLHFDRRVFGDADHPSAGPLFRPCRRYVHHDVLWRFHRFRPHRKECPGNLAQCPDGHQRGPSPRDAVRSRPGP